MKELQDLMLARMNDHISSGKLQEQMDKHVSSMMDELIRNQLGRYGDTAKALEEKIKASMTNALNNVSFPEYSQFVADLVVREYGAALNGQAAELFRKQIGEQLAPVPSDITADQFFTRMEELLADEIRSESGEIETEWDIRDKAIYITIGERSGQHIKLVFYDFINRDKDGHALCYIENDAGYILTSGIGGATQARGALDSYLYQLYCSKTEITGLANEEGRCLTHDYD